MSVARPGGAAADAPVVPTSLLYRFGRMMLRPWADVWFDLKVYGVETQIEAYRIFLGILGAAGYLRSDAPGSVLLGEVERAARAAQINTFGGGVVEVLREIVATAGLGMVRQAR